MTDSNTKPPHITYRRGASGVSRPAIEGRGIHVQTIVVATKYWGMTPEEIADDYDLPLDSVHVALAFYTEHQAEIDAAIAADSALEAEATGK
jgi:uncharacterized protein (DUF433 family)